MSRIYTSQEDYDKEFEEEFKNKVEEMAYYQGDRERTTLDGEWTESELREDIETEARKILHGTDGKTGWLEQNKHRAVYDKSMLHEEYIATAICDKYDIIEVYNKLYDKHRNDKPRLFGIHYFDEIAIIEIKKTLENNLVSK